MWLQPVHSNGSHIGFPIWEGARIKQVLSNTVWPQPYHPLVIFAIWVINGSDAFAFHSLIPIKATYVSLFFIIREKKLDIHFIFKEKKKKKGIKPESNLVCHYVPLCKRWVSLLRSTEQQQSHMSHSTLLFGKISPWLNILLQLLQEKLCVKV